MATGVSPFVIPFPPLAVADALSLGVLGGVAIIAALTFRHYGLGWDDYAHAEYGGLLLRLYESGFTDRRALSFVNLYAYGGGFDMFAALVAKVLPFDLFETRRLVGAFVGIAGLFITWRIARRVGGPLAGFVAIVLLATCPLYYGHMFINPKDAPFAVAMALLALALVRAFEQYPAPSVATIALVGISLGLSFGTRVMGALAAIPAVAALALILVVQARTGLRDAIAHLGKFIVRLLPALLIAYAVMALIWPWSAVSPLNPLHALFYFSRFFEKPWKELFDGQLLSVADMPRTYVPKLLLFTMPEAFLALGSIGIVAGLAAAANHRIPLERRAALLFLALSALFPVAFTIMMRPAMYNGLRHFVFILPPLAALGGAAAAKLLSWIGGDDARRTAIAGVALAALLAQPVIAVVRLHPYEYTFFNMTAGGMRAVDGRYMRDYWGLSLKQASQALLDVLAARGELATPEHKSKIAICGPQRPVRLKLGKNYPTDWQPPGADFAISLNEFYCAKLDRPVLAEVARDEVVYARIYDIRGRGVPSLLTIPPP